MRFRRSWLQPMGRYLGASLLLHFAWEILQLPLYTIWTRGSCGEQAYAIVHCTLGDVIIAGFCLMASLVMLAAPAWPEGRRIPVASIAMLLGLGYIVFSEWLNVTIRGSWAYAAEMPRLPPFGTGLTPFLQWIVVPALAFALTYRSSQTSSLA